MKLQSKRVPNPNGRPTGSKNKVTKELRKLINDFLNDNWQSVQDDFNQLEPKERLMFYERLMQYAVPKMQSVQILPDVENPVIVYENVSKQYKEG